MLPGFCMDSEFEIGTARLLFGRDVRIRNNLRREVMNRESIWHCQDLCANLFAGPG